MEHTKHIFRIFILAVLVFFSFLVVRGFYVPESWGVFGHYRANDIIDKVSLKPLHGGKDACKSCHEERVEELRGGVHKTLPCEGCHEPLSAHVTNDQKISDMPVHRSSEQCLICHQILDPRPKGFPQIDKDVHLRDQDIEPSPEVCLDCHNPHSPEL